MSTSQPVPEPRSVLIRAPASRSYVEILRSTVLIGGTSAVALLIGLVRTKAMAVLLGPAGFGLMGALTAIADLARSVADLGVNASGVRQIAEAVASGDEVRIATTATVLRRLSLALGLCGAAVLVAASPLVARATFGDGAHVGAVALLSLAVLLRLVSDGQGALLQGTRRIADLARFNVYGTAFGVVAAVALVWWLRTDGVAPAIVAIAAASLMTSWWYARKVPIRRIALSGTGFRRESVALIRLGVAFLASATLMMAAAWLVRLIVIRHDGLAMAGLYQSAWTIGGLYVGLVLQAMGSDFYPRLVGAIGDHGTANRLVDEQAQVSLLLGGPGVIATIALAPLVLGLLYSPEFVPATETLRWICLGMAVRIVTWPVGFVVVAKSRPGAFVAIELAWATINVALSWLLVQRHGPVGAAIALFGSYLVHAAVLYPVVRRMTGFRWSAQTRRTLLLQGFAVAAAFAAWRWLEPTTAATVSALLLAATLAAATRTLLRRVRGR
ncbi:MAG: O-antigen translocase [Steroidobacteraceae bacterium]|jgi:PST family polysaccharide transporter|nr:O-antigen translocase [Steroidobacteraceae bacterium]